MYKSFTDEATRSAGGGVAGVATWAAAKAALGSRSPSATAGAIAGVRAEGAPQVRYGHGEGFFDEPGPEERGAHQGQ